MQDVTEQRQKDLAAKEAQVQLIKHSRLSAMGMMASTLAHELNQPLTVAANYLALLETLPTHPGGLNADHLKTFSQRAMNKVLEAGEIIRRIRSFTVDGAVRAEPHLLRDLVYRALSALFGKMGPRKVSIINAVPNKVRVQVEAVMIENTIINIVRNAVEALTDTPNAQIRISARMSNGMAALRIADNGPGMSDDIAANVFSPFITTKTNGNGLGLPLCRTMVEANGGKLTLESHGADGTTFCLCLPLADTPDSEVGDD
jgi:two-component system sensor kinase FixL